MPYEDRLPLLGKGSFRGVEFFVERTDSQVGRRVVVHQYPARDDVTTEDMGRAPGNHRLTCFVLGPDYDEERQLLRVEFEKAGPGRLIHPFWGEMTVVVITPPRIRETFRGDMGMARFDLEVVEVGAVKLTVAEPSLEPIVDDTADAALEAAGDSFEDTFSIAGAIEAVRASATGAIQTMTQGLRKARGAANAAISLVDDVGSAIDELEATAAALLSAPADLVAAVQGVNADVFAALAELDAITAQSIAEGALAAAGLDGGRIFEDYRADQTLDALTTTLETADTFGDVKQTGSTQAEIEQTNQTAILRLFDTAAVIEASRAFALYEFDSRDKAIEIRDTLATEIDSLSEDSSDQLWGALSDLKAAVGAKLTDTAVNLPEIVEYTPKQTAPALVLAYNIHGDATRDEEIIARNRLSDPNFVAGSVPIKVIADG
jgi:prophage DNA circulation protein